VFFFLIIHPPPISTLFPYTTLFRSEMFDWGPFEGEQFCEWRNSWFRSGERLGPHEDLLMGFERFVPLYATARSGKISEFPAVGRSEEHTSELQSLAYLVCRLLLEKK